MKIYLLLLLLAFCLIGCKKEPLEKLPFHSTAIAEEVRLIVNKRGDYYSFYKFKYDGKTYFFVPRHTITEHNPSLEK